MVRRQRAFTILEVLVAGLLFGLLSTALFQAFRYGSVAFQRASSRQDAQSALRTAYLSLRDDLRKSHFHSISVLPRTQRKGDLEVRRDALCLAGVKDWSAAASFDAVNGLPKWDRYILYYGTASGKLVRTLIDLDRPDYSPSPFDDLDPDTYLQEDPALNRGYQSSFRIMTRDLDVFECRTEPASDQIEVGLLLVDRQGRKNEVRLTVYPQNTWPKGEE